MIDLTKILPFSAAILDTVTSTDDCVVRKPIIKIVTSGSRWGDFGELNLKLGQDPHLTYLLIGYSVSARAERGGCGLIET